MIFLLGQHGSGKSELAKQMSQDYGLLNIDTGQLLRKERQGQSLEHESTVMWCDRMDNANGPGYVNELLKRAIVRKVAGEILYGEPFQDVIIVGKRSIVEIDELTACLSLCPKPQIRERTIIAIQVDESIAHARFQQRNRKPGDRRITLESYLVQVRKEEELGLSKALKHGDFIVENNLPGIENLFGSVRHIMEHQRGYISVEGVRSSGKIEGIQSSWIK
ncbi:MAG: ATP-binding protein [bacterium]|nr:ATP-binding protein [bacterium]